MAGSLWESPPIVPVVNPSQLSMLLLVLKEDFRFCDNEIRDTTATLLTEICSNICAEPHLQPLSNENLNGASALRDDCARLE